MMARICITTAVLISTILRGCHFLAFECYPNTTMRIENPSNYTSVFANNSVNVCTTTWTEGRTHVFLEDCNMDDDILLFFSYLDSTLNHVVGGRETGKATYIINCLQIPLTGETRTVGVAVEVSVGMEDSQYHRVGVYSNLYSDIISRTIINVAPIGTPLFWLIESKMEDFKVRPDECWVYAGKAVLDNVPKKRIITEGCSHDDGLVQDFIHVNTTTENLVMAIFYSFRFYSSEYTTLHCKVRICSRPSTACDINCSNEKRRRRSINAEADDNNGDSSDRFEFINSQIRVIDELVEIKFNSASFGLVNIWQVFAWLVLKISFE